MSQSDSGDGSEMTLLVLFVNKTFITPILMTPPLQKESLNKNQNSEIVKLWITELIPLESGATWLVSIKEPTMLSAATCNCSWLKRNNNRFLRVLPPLSLTCQWLTPMITRTPCSASVKRKPTKTLKNFISWKLVLQLQVNRNSRNLLISKCNKMGISQYWCKIAQSSELFSLSPNSVSCTCMKSQQLVFFTDKKSPTNSVSFPPETPLQMVWLWSTEVVKSSLLMLRQTTWFHILIQQATLPTTKLFHSSSPKDSIYLELMKYSSNFSTKKLLQLIMEVQPTLLEMLQELFWETRTPLTFSRIFHRLVVQLQFWSISMLFFKQLSWMPSNLSN